MNESTVKEEKPTIEVEKSNSKLFDFENYTIFQLILYPFAIYIRQFFKYFLVALIPEFIFFGIFRLINIDINYNIINGTWDASLDFISDGAAAAFFILLVLAVIIYLFRGGVLSSITWKSAEKGRANPIWAIEATARQSSKFVLTAFIMIFFMTIPSIFIILALIYSGNDRLQGLSWFLIAASLALPIIFGSRICLFSTGITKDYYAAGTSFQKSWEFTKGKLWLRTSILLVIFASLSVIGPFILTQVFSDLAGSVSETYRFWAEFGMIFGRALLYPLLDISLTMSYMNAQSLALNKAVFKEDIKRQQLLSEKFMQSKQNKY